MPDTPCDNSYRLVSLVHGSTYFYDPLGATVDESVEFFEHRPGTRISPALALDRYSLRCTFRCGYPITPITRGTSGTIVITAKQVDLGANNTVTLTNMLAGAASFSFDSSPHEMRQEFHFTAGNSENYAPISVSVG
jgi:hypothetical protein